MPLEVPAHGVVENLTGLVTGAGDAFQVGQKDSIVGELILEAFLLQPFGQQFTVSLALGYQILALMTSSCNPNGFHAGVACCNLCGQHLTFLRECRVVTVAIGRVGGFGESSRVSGLVRKTS